MLRNHKKSIRRNIKIRSSSVMSVNIYIIKEIHKNHKEETDITIKTEETQVFMYQKWNSESAL